MDMTPYSNYLLCMGTLRLCRRIKEEHPELWAQICTEAEQAESETAVHADGSEQ